MKLRLVSVERADSYLISMYMLLSLQELCTLLESELLGSGHLHSHNTNGKVAICMHQHHPLECCPFVPLICLFASA